MYDVTRNFSCLGPEIPTCVSIWRVHFKNVPKDFIKLKSEKLSVDEVSELVVSPCCGAVSLFIGEFNILLAKAVLFLFFPSVVPITEASVIIAVSSPHRAESLEAVTYCINTLKASVPIWKKETEVLWSQNE
uniref:Molybdopterin synthase catalytic subunit n=1 Tax=Malurus cyaneus samueli TaxID=2593467 RepID=A0A8C5U808_9PASS